MKCYRCWFRDGSAMLVDADDEQEAREAAERTSNRQHEDPRVQAIYGRGWLKRKTTVKTVECLD